MAVRPVTVSNAAPKASRSAPKNTAKGATKKGPVITAGEDESDEIDFGDDAPAAKPAKKQAAKAAPAKGKGHVVKDVTEERAPRNKAGKSKMAKGDIELTFAFVKDTGGTYQYREVDEAGEILPMSTAVMGGAYLRKSMVTGELPKSFTITVHLG